MVHLNSPSRSSSPQVRLFSVSTDLRLRLTCASCKTEEAPSGMLARGTYNVRSRVVDDDGTVYADFAWSFALAKVCHLLLLKILADD